MDILRSFTILAALLALAGINRPVTRELPRWDGAHATQTLSPLLLEFAAAHPCLTKADLPASPALAVAAVLPQAALFDIGSFALRGTPGPTDAKAQRQEARRVYVYAASGLSPPRATV